jgi:hypothetical protein
MTSREVTKMTGNIEELLKQEKKNRPELQAENTGYNRISKNGLEVYKTKDSEQKSKQG